MHHLGLALSGGGSRAVAFHFGKLFALAELKLAENVDVVSTVSGGSLFGAAWMAARNSGNRDDDFIRRIQEELARGFIVRCLRPALIRALLPGLPYSRTHLLADTFDRVLLHGLSLGDL